MRIITCPGLGKWKGMCKRVPESRLAPSTSVGTKTHSIGNLRGANQNDEEVDSITQNPTLTGNRNQKEEAIAPPPKPNPSTGESALPIPIGGGSNPGWRAAEASSRPKWRTIDFNIKYGSCKHGRGLSCVSTSAFHINTMGWIVDKIYMLYSKQNL
jgi:hypothetical protein